MKIRILFRAFNPCVLNETCKFARNPKYDVSVRYKEAIIIYEHYEIIKIVSRFCR